MTPITCAQSDEKAFSHFERAARFESDGDSMFNAGMCHMAGRGTVRSVEEGMRLFLAAVAKFGHFGSVYELGRIFYDGAPPVRHATCYPLDFCPLPLFPPPSPSPTCCWR